MPNENDGFRHDQALKTLPAYFEDVYEGRKTFEVRKRDEREFCCPLDQCGIQGVDGMSIKRCSPLALAWG